MVVPHFYVSQALNLILGLMLLCARGDGARSQRIAATKTPERQRIVAKDSHHGQVGEAVVPADRAHPREAAGCPSAGRGDCKS